MPWRDARVRRRAIVVVAIVVLVAGYYWWHGRAEPVRYVTAEATRGDVVRTITTTGAVDPVITVMVGAYVSGTIQSCSCDYNTQVKAGQLCAKIDPRPYQMVVDQDSANLANAQAQLSKDQAGLAYAKINYERDTRLLKHGVVSQDAVDSDLSVYEQSQAQVKLDQASIEQRKAELSAAQVNLDYTNIVSPVDGTVVSRNITIGQTVAASFQTPTLFLIAQDLTKMQVDTNVSESDIGGARAGEKATFTVEAYPGRTFEGRVSQVRQAPITVQNVVTYDVVVSVDNDDLALVPGMTANTRIVTDEHDDVVRVPLQALRFSPRGLRSDGDGERRGGGASVHVLRDGKLEKVAISTGLKDATYAEVVHGAIQPGDRVVVDQASDGTSPKPQGGPPAQGPPAMRRGLHL